MYRTAEFRLLWPTVLNTLPSATPDKSLYTEQVYGEEVCFFGQCRNIN